MALCESPCGNTDAGVLGSCPTTPPFMNTYPTASSTPLMLPRDWSESFCMPVASALLPENYDFQSNHLEHARLPFGIIPSLAGLGIKNVDLEKEAGLKDTKFALYTTGNLSPVQGQDSRRHQRTHRTDSVYDALSETHDFSTFQNQQVYNYELGSSWTLSSILRATEFTVSKSASEPIHLVASVPISEPCASSTLMNAPQSVCDGEDDIAWCFEKLSAATGLSVADFAAQLSASAEATLKRMGTGSDLDSSLSTTISNTDVSSFTHAFDDSEGPLIWPPLSSEMNLALPFVDINLRTLDLSWKTNCIGVDPADILPNSQSSLPQLTNSMGDSASSDFGNNLSAVAPLPLVPLTSFQDALTMDIHRSQEQSRLMLKDEVRSPSEEPYTLPLLKNTPRIRASHQPSDDDAFESPSSSEYSPFLQPLGSKRNHSSRISTHRAIQQADAEMSPIGHSKDANLQHLPPINLGTPVFDAHRGINLEELKAKAERYRLRNQGREYDKRWLISFAGKLSERGELVDEFRCYVAGCKQMNKRRDHILIHVGAHLDQRPFKCLHCSARFLRKNECKRHELSHTGVRPFSCHLCPVPATTFVRQDLLKRHMKRTHRYELKIDKENEEPTRPKKRAKF